MGSGRKTRSGEVPWCPLGMKAKREGRPLQVVFYKTGMGGWRGGGGVGMGMRSVKEYMY